MGIFCLIIILAIVSLGFIHRRYVSVIRIDSKLQARCEVCGCVDKKAWLYGDSGGYTTELYCRKCGHIFVEHNPFSGYNQSEARYLLNLYKTSKNVKDIKIEGYAKKFLSEGKKDEQ